VIVGYCMSDVGKVSVNLDYIKRASVYNKKIIIYGLCNS
jgi:hypothetical protein